MFVYAKTEHFLSLNVLFVVQVTRNNFFFRRAKKYRNRERITKCQGPDTNIIVSVFIFIHVTPFTDAKPHAN